VDRLLALRERGAWGGAMLGALFDVPTQQAVTCVRRLTGR
jgi:hypothetical protein